MRTLLAALALALAVSAACSEKTPAEPPASRDRPLAQDGTTARAYTSAPDRTKVQLDLAAVRGAILTYKGEHGAFPPSIAELKVDGLNYPRDLVYDPGTGSVRSETYPDY